MTVLGELLRGSYWSIRSRSRKESMGMVMLIGDVLWISHIIC